MSIKVPINPTYHEVVNEKAINWEQKKSTEYHKYRKKWLDNPRDFILEDAPLHLDIEPTNACNLKCPMCPRTVLLAEDDGKKKLKLGYMDFELYKNLIDQAAKIGVYSIKLNWLGEPLMHPRLVDMVKYAKEQGIIDVMFNTNAVLLSEKMILNLIDAGLDRIFFSFDSPVKETYEKVRVGANYDDVLTNIKNINKIKAMQGIDYPLTRVSMVLMKNNKQELQQYIELFEDIVDITAYVEYREPLGKDDSNNEHFNFACSQLWQRMFVAWDGEVVVCCVDAERENIVGNVNNDGIKSIWQNEKYAHIRNKHKVGKYYEISMCKKCGLPQKTKDGTV
jgi:radical SAM protein with 4Fe4S-binding SPASM domain